MHGRSLTDTDCFVVNFHGRRGSVDRLIKHELYQLLLWLHAAVDFEKVGIDSPIKVVLEENVDTSMLEDKVLGESLTSAILSILR